MYFIYSLKCLSHASFVIFPLCYSKLFDCIFIQSIDPSCFDNTFITLPFFLFQLRIPDRAAMRMKSRLVKKNRRLLLISVISASKTCDKLNSDAGKLILPNKVSCVLSYSLLYIYIWPNISNKNILTI